MEKQETMSIAAAITGWLDSESVSFTAICGDSFTHAEVIITAIGTMAVIWMVIVGTWLANWLAGGAA